MYFLFFTISDIYAYKLCIDEAAGSSGIFNRVIYKSIHNYQDRRFPNYSLVFNSWFLDLNN